MMTCPSSHSYDVSGNQSRHPGLRLCLIPRASASLVAIAEDHLLVKMLSPSTS